MSMRRIPKPVRHPSRQPVPKEPPPAAQPSAEIPPSKEIPPSTAVQELATLVAQTGLELPGEALPPLERYLHALLAKNQLVNLTAIREPQLARILHVLDSLQLWGCHSAPSLALDIGSGNGFPGVAAAALWPSARVLLLDRTQKKVRAISECLKEAGISNAEALAADAQQLPALRPELCGEADLITLRAVGPLAGCLRLAEPFLAKDGVIVLFKASELSREEARAGDKMRKQLRLRQAAERSYLLPGDQERVRKLLCYRRV